MRAHAVLGILAVLGCKRSGSDERIAAAPPAAPIADARPLHDYPPSSRAAIPSPPRDRWPCAVEIQEHQGMSAHGIAVFHYGKRAACRLPIDLVALGIWGCPESFTRTDTDGTTYDRTFAYDRDSCLTDVMASIHTSYAWDGDRLAKTTREQWGIADVATYRDRDAQLIAVDDKDRLQQEITLDGALPLALDEYANGFLGSRARIEWSEGHPQHISVDVKGPILGSVTRDVLYTCPK